MNGLTVTNWVHDLRQLQHAGAAFVPAMQPNYVGFTRWLRTGRQVRGGFSRDDFDLFGERTTLCRVQTLLVSAACFPRYRSHSFIERDSRPAGAKLLTHLIQRTEAQAAF